MNNLEIIINYIADKSHINKSEKLDLMYNIQNLKVK